MKKITSITLKADSSLLQKMLDFYEPFKETPPSNNMILFARGEECTVSIYAPKNGISSVLYQGERALEEARLFVPDYNPPLEVKHSSAALPPRNIYPEIGSDEVGTGDFFGPIIVAAGFVRKEDLTLLEELGVIDSKKMEDSYILSIGPRLIANFDYSELSLPPSKFNEIHDTYNMNALKAKMHNRCLFNLKSRHPEANLYMDQFAAPPLYYSYLKDEPSPLKGITFSPKGESLFPSVALGSVIARYSFLRKMKMMDEEHQTHFPFGAGKDVDVFLKEYMETHDEKELRLVGKLSFSNYKRLL